MAKKSGRKPPLVADRRYPAQPRSSKAASAPKPKAKAAAKPARRKAAPARRSRSRGGIRGFFGAVLGWFLRLVWRLTWRFSMVVALLVALGVGVIYASLPEMSALVDGRARGSVTMQDREGAVFAWRGDQFGGVVTAESVSPNLKNAILATEDRRFYSHFGISPRGIIGAIRINLREGRGPLSGHGGSTITQQTAKLLCLGVEYVASEWKSQAAYEADCRQGSLWRKGKEALYALAMELKYSKDEILTIYLNRAYMGGGAYGAEAAAQRFFGKPASAVTAAEGAMIAGLLTAPTSLAPTNNLERSQNRAAVVIGLMREQGYLTEAQAQAALDNPAELSEAAEARAGGYFADWVMSTGPEFFTRNTADDVIIRTTLDRRLQTAAEDAMRYIFEEKVKEGSKAQAAIVVMSADGAVRAMVGGRDTKVTGAFNRATQALRQTGSSFKPFVYATALETGYSPLDTVVDEPFCMTIPGSGQWCPDNYTHKHYGQITLARALRDSLNVPAIKVSEQVGRDLVRQVAEGFGIRSDLAAGPALALGVSESTLIEMTGAYAGIMNGGSSVTPYGLTELKLQGDDAPLIDKVGGIGERVIRTEAAQQLIWMMEQVVSDGTGHRAALPGWQAAGTTGTTQSARAAGFIGFTSQYVAGVWMGYDDNTPLSGVTGAGLPAEIWHETMVRVHEGLTPTPLPMMEPAGAAQARDQNAGSGGGLESGVERLLRGLLGGEPGTAPQPQVRR
ncbi:transglycosylase domain-containing protein [Pseudooceanicola sp.]|uniref:transglycosylase domain-containing protein n=1 Tax=Pseudooceanicola sp. TaxID=1914328 RepID=UPI003519BA57